MAPDDCTSHKRKKTSSDTQKSFIEVLVKEAFEDRTEVPVAELKEMAEVNGIQWFYFSHNRPKWVKPVSRGNGKGKNKKTFYWVMCEGVKNSES